LLFGDLVIRAKDELQFLLGLSLPYALSVISIGDMAILLTMSIDDIHKKEG
jgi:hypothetical protein